MGGAPVLIDHGLGFSVDLRPAQGDLVGYRARPHSGVIDLDRIGAYPVAEFWDELRTTEGRLILDPGAFYILVSRESVAILRRIRRMILPERVFGRPGAHWMTSGTAMGPISLRTHC